MGHNDGALTSCEEVKIDSAFESLKTVFVTFHTGGHQVSGKFFRSVLGSQQNYVMD